MAMVQRLAAGVLAASMSTGALAQVVTPVPPAPPPTPDFKPPEPPPPAPTPANANPTPPAAPPEVELPPIDIVQRDSQGKVVVLATPAEEAVAEAILTHLTDAEAKDKLRKLIDDRRAAAQNTVARHAEIVLSARERLGTLDSVTDTRQLSQMNADLIPATLKPGLIDMAQQLHVLTPKQVKVARDAVKAYREAFTKEARDASGGDPIKMIEPAMKANVRINATEPMRDLDTLLDALAQRWGDVRGGIGLTDAQAAEVAPLERDFRSAPNPAAKREALAKVLRGLSSQQQSMALLTIAPTMPEGLPEAPPPPASRPRVAPKPKPEKAPK